uniref:F5/8 type C domain-containing protein n=1 Tax=Panagrellus redivivus TaxID=6233 RepID=A0A7E4VFH0_PANRE
MSPASNESCTNLVKLGGTNFATAKYGAKIIIDNKDVFFSDRFLKEIDIKTEEVVIDLGQCFKLNYFTIDFCADPRSVWKAETVSVSVSVDNENWICITDDYEIFII